MSIQTTYSQARANLAALMDEVTDNLEVVVIKRRGREPVAMIAESELSSLLETHHLLSSPKNANRLLKAVKRTDGTKAMTTEELKREVGLEER